MEAETKVDDGECKACEDACGCPTRGSTRNSTAPAGCAAAATAAAGVPRLSIGAKMTSPPSPTGSLSPRRAHPEFLEALNEHFPGAQKEAFFFDGCVAELETRGFTDENTIACIGICRDEICGSLMDEVKARFGDLFIFRGLGGFIFCGKTGMNAAHAHSPICEGGREKYLYVVASHIGITAEGELGRVSRRGREGEASHACGALAYFHSQLVKGKVDTRLKMDDIEMSVMSQLLIHNIKWGEVPNLAEITKVASRIIAEKQLEEIIGETVDTNRADYAVIAGVQIHGPGLQQTYFWPMMDLCYGMVDGKRVMLDVGESRPRKATTAHSHVRAALEHYIPSAGPCAAFEG